MKDLNNDIVILGHTSYIGKHLFKYLKKKYNPKKIVGLNSKNIDLTKKIKVQKLKKYINSNTIVLLLSANKSQKNTAINILNDNFKIIYNLSFFFIKNPPKKLLYFSSQVVFGESVNNLNTHEDTKMDPTSYYGLSKIIGENIFKNIFKNLTNSNLVILRMPRIYGEGDDINNYGPTKFSYLASKNKNIKIWGDGEELREYIYIGDLIKIIDKIIYSRFSGILNIASGTVYSFITLIRIIEKINNKKIRISKLHRTEKKVNHIFNNKKFKEIFPNFKFTNMKVGLKILIKDFKKNL